jgi:hypothetical protein
LTTNDFGNEKHIKYTGMGGVSGNHGYTASVIGAVYTSSPLETSIIGGRIPFLFHQFLASNGFYLRLQHGHGHGHRHRHGT